MVQAWRGLYCRLLTVCARSSQGRALTGSLATPLTIGTIQIKRGGDPYDTFDHANFRGKTPSLFAPPAMAHTAACGPLVTVPINGAR